jgi:hypothetical protein
MSWKAVFQLWDQITGKEEKTPEPMKNKKIER